MGSYTSENQIHTNQPILDKANILTFKRSNMGDFPPCLGHSFLHWTKLSFCQWIIYFYLSFYVSF